MWWAYERIWQLIVSLRFTNIKRVAHQQISLCACAKMMPIYIYVLTIILSHVDVDVEWTWDQCFRFLLIRNFNVLSTKFKYIYELQIYTIICYDATVVVVIMLDV